MKKLVNNSTVGQKLLITRRVDGKLTKAQIFLKPGDAYVFKNPPDLLGSIYMDYYKALSAIGIHYIEVDETVTLNQDTPIVVNEVVSTQETSTKEAVDPFEEAEIVEDTNSVVSNTELESKPVISDSDKSTLTGFLESTYNKAKLIELAESKGLETYGTKYEIATRIVDNDPQSVINLMNE